jgi:hypothetical protein
MLQLLSKLHEFLGLRSAMSCLCGASKACFPVLFLLALPSMVQSELQEPRWVDVLSQLGCGFNNPYITGIYPFRR